jgi:hypothetical protein
MSHPVIPTDFPENPDLGDTHTSDDSVWTYTNIGWVKTVIIRNHADPIYPGLIVKTA